MARIALLPTIGQTHILGEWFKSYENWQHEIDKLYINVAGSSHGGSLKEMMSWVKKDDILMFIEEDAIIFKTGIVEECFKEIEEGNYDALGSPRMSCHPEIAIAAKKKWKLDYTGFGDKGPNYWPNFFFCKVSDLLKTDLDFGAKSWKQGDYIKELDHTVKEKAISGDTFVWISIQLRAMGLKIKEIPQYHCSPYDLQDHQEKKNIFDGECPWFHLGSLAGNFHHPNSDMERLELERRTMWHQLCGKDMKEVIDKYGLDKGRIEEWLCIYKNLLNEN